MWPHWCCIRGERSLPSPHWVILYLMHPRMPFSFFAARTTAGSHSSLVSTRTPRSSSFPAGWPTACTSAWGCSFIPNFALPLVELPKILGSPFLQTFEVPLHVTVTLWHESHFSSFSVMSKLAESSLCPNIWTINEDAKQQKCYNWQVLHTRKETSLVWKIVLNC